MARVFRSILRGARRRFGNPSGDYAWQHGSPLAGNHRVVGERYLFANQFGRINGFERLTASDWP